MLICLLESLYIYFVKDLLSIAVGVYYLYLHKAKCPSGCATPVSLVHQMKNDSCLFGHLYMCISNRIMTHKTTRNSKFFNAWLGEVAPPPYIIAITPVNHNASSTTFGGGLVVCTTE